MQIRCLFNNKQRWNNDKCRFECKELIDKGIWDKGFTWNLENIQIIETVNVEKD